MNTQVLVIVRAGEHHHNYNIKKVGIECQGLCYITQAGHEISVA